MERFWLYHCDCDVFTQSCNCWETGHDCRVMSTFVSRWTPLSLHVGVVAFSPVYLPYMCINWHLWNKGSCKHELMITTAACWNSTRRPRHHSGRWVCPTSELHYQECGWHLWCSIVTYMGSKGPRILSPISSLAQTVYMCSSRTVFYSTEIKASKCLIPRLG